MRRAISVLLVVFIAVPAAGSRSAAATCGAAGTPTTTVYLPNITKTLGGPSGWVTPFIVQNVGAASTTLEVSFYRFSDGSLVTCRSVPGLLPGTSFADMPNNDADLPADSQFSVVVRSFGSQVVSVVNQHQGAGERAEALSYVGLSQGATRVSLPYVAKAVSGWTTTSVIQGLGTADANVTAAFASADGTRTASLTRRIAPGRSAVVDPTVEPALVSGTEYAVVLTSDQPIAVVVNAHNDAPAVARPMGFSYNGVATSGADPAYLPYVARNTDGIARTTRVIVQNAGTADATPTLSFRSSGGTVSTIVAPSAVRPGRSWSFDPLKRADGTTACPATATTGCVAEGEHGLVVSGGTFAVLGVTLSPATAMGMTAARPAASRLYLPNITRTLGGTSGWTTPIVLQSAGATTATLRWYRLADGKLAATQYVPSLVSGGSVRIDPRSVSGLTDDAQYAVVADFAGQATAHVLELSALGGDGGMAYEGFPASGTITGAPIPTSISLSPATATVTLGSTQQFTATVRDQFGNAYTGVPLTWTVTPATAGTISTSGLFTAGSTAVSGELTANFERIVATATVSVSEYETRTVGGIAFHFIASEAVDIYVELGDWDRTLSWRAPTPAEARAELDSYVARVSSNFARSFPRRPSVYVFKRLASYETGFRTIFGFTPTKAADYAKTAVGVAIGDSAVGTNVEVQMHELTHVMIGQIAGYGVPTWLNEGSAFLDSWEVWAPPLVQASPYLVASRAAVGKLPALEDCYSAGGSVCAEGTRFLRADVGGSGVLRIFDLIGSGLTFEQAYARVAGKDFDAFRTGFASRARSAVATYPSIVTFTTKDPGTRIFPPSTSLSYVLVGFQPSSSVTISVTEPGGSRSDTYTTSEAGWVWRGLTWVAGTYTVTASGPAGSASVTTTVRTP